MKNCGFDKPCIELDLIKGLPTSPIASTPVNKICLTIIPKNNTSSPTLLNQQSGVTL